jgi:enoyl-CoA hydratase/carnithine racemase
MKAKHEHNPKRASQTRRGSGRQRNTVNAIQVQALEQVEVWTLNNESRRNALSRSVVDALATEIDAVNLRPDARVIVVRGAGDKAFCAGADLKERADMTVDEVRLFLQKLRQTFCAFESSNKVFVAYLNGSALGGGLELALSCDLRFAAPHAECGLTEVTLGIIPGAGGTQRLPRIVGKSIAKSLILSGRKVGAAEAVRLGLVEKSAPFDEVLALAQNIARNAPLALAAAKHAVDEGLTLSMAEALELESSYYSKTLSSIDRTEGLKAFAEKRAPRFIGK